MGVRTQRCSAPNSSIREMLELRTMFVLMLARTGTTLLGLTWTLILWKIWLAARDARRFERDAMIFWNRGLCPCCGKDVAGISAVCCPHCKNYIEGFRRMAKKQASAR